jgi:type VI secretion system secreted protein Hcp
MALDAWDWEVRLDDDETWLNDEAAWLAVEAAASAPGRAAVDAFLKLDGVDGESQDSKHKNEIEVIAWIGGVEQTGTAHFGGGSGSGRSIHHGFKIAKRVDKSTPKLFLACATGEHIKKAEIVVRKAGKEQQEYLKYTLSDVLVSGHRSFKKPDPESNADTEGVEISYSKLELEVKEQKPDGTLGGQVKGGWDVKANKKV